MKALTKEDGLFRLAQNFVTAENNDAFYVDKKTVICSLESETSD